MSGQEEYKEYEELMKFLFNEIKARDGDPDVEEIKNTSEYICSKQKFHRVCTNPSTELEYNMQLGVDLIIKKEMYKAFIDKVRTNGKWDFKPKLQKAAKKFYSKNKIWPNTGEGHISYGFEMPGDNGYVYNYDIISNVHYGVVALKAGFSAFEADKGAKLHDWSHGHDFFETFFGNNTDGNAVRLGMDKIYPLGKKLTLQNLKDTLFVFRNRLNRTRRDELIEASHDVRKGESLYSIAFQNGVDVKLVQQKNPEYAKYSAISPLPAGAKITLPTPKEIRNRIIAEREEKKHIKELMQSRAYHDKTDPDHTTSVQTVAAYHAKAEAAQAQETKMLEHLQQVAKTPTGTRFYIWRTSGDDRVRERHSAREGGIYDWNAPPEGGHPGEEYGCRCTAEKYFPFSLEWSEEDKNKFFTSTD